MNQLVTEPNNPHGQTLDHILLSSGQSVVHDVKVLDFIPNHALIKCLVDFPGAVVYTKKRPFKHAIAEIGMSSSQNLMRFTLPNQAWCVNYINTTGMTSVEF